MTTIASIDELNTATEMPQQMEAPEATLENKQAFNEAVARFQAALGDGAAFVGFVDAMTAADEKGTGTTVVATVGEPLLQGTAEETPHLKADAAVTPRLQEGTEETPLRKADVVVPPRLQEGAEETPLREAAEEVTLGLQESAEKTPRQRTVAARAPLLQGVVEEIPGQPEAQVVLQAAPMMTVPLDSTVVQRQVSDTLKVTSVESAAAMRSQTLVAAVEEVCEAIQVSPGIQPGQGEVRIQLKANVLSGTEVFLEAKGTTITVAFNPATAEVAEILSRNITQFEQHLAGRVHNYQIAAKVRKLKG